MYKQLKFDSCGRCTNAFEVIRSVETLKMAYETIKSKPGNMVMGTDRVTLDGISEKWFNEISERITRERYQPLPSRRVYIPKPNGKKRPLGISSPRDKIIQQAMRLVLEVILEPKFLDSSHGFRPKRGCHSALESIRSWRGVPWIIEGDIKSYFDSIDHHLLAGLLAKHFQEQRLFNLYWKMVKAGYVEWDKGRRILHAADCGVPQGGIISPLLSNLVLHELDVYMEQLITKRETLNSRVKKHINNPEYYKLNNLAAKLRKDHPKSKELRQLLTRRRKIKARKPNPDYINYSYVRYADDWMIGVWGTKEQAREIKEDIKNFLSKLGLTLSTEKTLITNTRSDRAKFLGVYIKRIASATGSLIAPNAASNLWMTVPIELLLKRLKERGFWKTGTKGYHPLGITTFIPLPIKEMIIRYRSILSGFLNYYSFSDNRYTLRRIYYILKRSLQKTICRKLNIGIRECLKEYGRNVTLSIKKRNGENVKLNFVCPSLKRNPLNFMGTQKYEDPLTMKNWRISTISALGQPCANCGDSKNVEMHHVKHIKTINPKLDSFGKMMARINRKQIPLCRLCHNKVHKGTYAGFTLKHFSYIRWEGQPKWS